MFLGGAWGMPVRKMSIDGFTTLRKIKKPANFIRNLPVSLSG